MKRGNCYNLNYDMNCNGFNRNQNQSGRNYSITERYFCRYNQNFLYGFRNLFTVHLEKSRNYLNK